MLLIIVGFLIIVGIFYFYIKRMGQAVNIVKDETIKKDEITSDNLVKNLNNYFSYFKASPLVNPETKEVLAVEVFCKQNKNFIYIDFSDSSNIDKGCLLFKYAYNREDVVIQDDDLIYLLDRWNNAEHELPAKANAYDTFVNLEYLYEFSENVSSKDLAAELLLMSSEAVEFFENYIKPELDESDLDDEVSKEDISPETIKDIIDRRSFRIQDCIGLSLLDILSKKYNCIITILIHYNKEDYFSFKYEINRKGLSVSENSINDFIDNWNNKVAHKLPVIAMYSQEMSKIWLDYHFKFYGYVFAKNLNSDLSLFAETVDDFNSKLSEIIEN